MKWLCLHRYNIEWLSFPFLSYYSRLVFSGPDLIHHCWATMWCDPYLQDLDIWIKGTKLSPGGLWQFTLSPVSHYDGTQELGHTLLGRVPSLLCIHTPTTSLLLLSIIFNSIQYLLFSTLAFYVLPHSFLFTQHFQWVNTPWKFSG